jgi:hypothetical protein
VAQPRGEPLLGRARRLREEELPPRDGELREEADEEHDDADAADPLREGAPHEQDGPTTREVGQHGRAGGREARHRLEVGVERPEHAGAEEGERPEAGTSAQATRSAASASRRVGSPWRGPGRPLRPHAAQAEPEDEADAVPSAKPADGLADPRAARAPQNPARMRPMAATTVPTT